jgi:hypothetical protein
VQVSVGALGVPLARNPKLVEPPAGSDPLYETLLTDAVEPLVVSVPFQTWVMVWPLANVHFTVQPVMAELPAVTVTEAW